MAYVKSEKEGKDFNMVQMSNEFFGHFPKFFEIQVREKTRNQSLDCWLGKDCKYQSSVSKLSEIAETISSTINTCLVLQQQGKREKNPLLYSVLTHIQFQKMLSLKNRKLH